MSIKRLIDSGFELCGFSLYWDPHLKLGPAESVREQLELAETLEREGHIRIVRTRRDIQTLVSGTLSVVLHLEGCRVLEDGIGLDELVSRGLRSLSLTWNEQNSFASGTGLDVDPEGGLTTLGRHLVDQCRDQGLVVDLAHLSDGGVRDLSHHDQGVLVATHANLRSVKSHRRNLSDEVAALIASRGGAIGLTLVPGFIAEGERVHVDRLLDHVRHARRLGIENVLCSGSDFDGTTLPEGLTDCSDWARWILERGDELPDSFRGDSMIRAFEEVLP